MTNINVAESPVLFNAAVLKRYPVAFARDSVERASAVFGSDGY
jgi:hypothetical protein